jgi:hypothetical protein
MPKRIPARLMMVAALAGTATVAMLLPAVAASAKTKPPLTASCTLLFGNASVQTVSGCAATSGAPKISAYGLTEVNSGDNGATIYWTDKKYTTESFTYSFPTNTCPTLFGATALTEATESASITGGNAKLTTGAIATTTNVCIYEQQTSGPNDGEFIVQSIQPLVL